MAGGGEQCAVHEQCMKGFEDYNDNQKVIVEKLGELKVAVSKNEESSKSAHHRIDTIEKQTTAIVKMSISVDHLVEQIKDLVALQKEQNARIDKLEKDPVDIQMAVNIEALTKGIDKVVANQGKHDERIGKLERGPGDFVIKMVIVFTSSLVGGIATMLLTAYIKSKG